MDLGLGLLGLVAGSGANKFEGVGPYVEGACGLDRGRVMDGWRRSKVSRLRGYLEAAAKKREVSEKPGLQAIRRQVLFKTNLTPLSNVHFDILATIHLPYISCDLSQVAAQRDSNSTLVGEHLDPQPLPSPSKILRTDRSCKP